MGAAVVPLAMAAGSAVAGAAKGGGSDPTQANLSPGANPYRDQLFSQKGFDQGNYYNNLQNFQQGNLSNEQLLSNVLNPQHDVTTTNYTNAVGNPASMLDFFRADGRQGIKSHTTTSKQDNLTSAQKQAAINDITTNPLSGSLFATNEVQNNPLLGQVFGKGGEYSQGLAKEQDLQNQGFKLQPQDVEAYGQASGNIARMFGQQGNSLAQSLASRGLSQGPSGAAGAAFSGLQGNKNEQLARAQTDIANQRMQNTLQRLTQQQNMNLQLGNMGRQSIQDQYGRQLSGVQNQQANTLNASNSIGNQNQGNTQNQIAAAGVQSANPLDAITGGIMSGVSGGLGAGVSKGIGSIFGGAATGATK